MSYSAEQADTKQIITKWAETVTIKRKSVSYDAASKPTRSWTDVTTADVEIQPATGFQRMMEAGEKIQTTHILYGYHDALDAKLDIQSGDRVVDAALKIYTVKYVEEYEDHFEVKLSYTEGKD